MLSASVKGETFSNVFESKKRTESSIEISLATFERVTVFVPCRFHYLCRIPSTRYVTAVALYLLSASRGWELRATMSETDSDRTVHFSSWRKGKEKEAAGSRERKNAQVLQSGARGACDLQTLRTTDGKRNAMLVSA